MATRSKFNPSRTRKDTLLSLAVQHQLLVDLESKELSGKEVAEIVDYRPALYGNTPQKVKASRQKLRWFKRLKASNSAEFWYVLRLVLALLTSRIDIKRYH
jgi:hypothetical protein